MIYLLDTNAVTDAMNEHPALRGRIATAMATDRLATCAVVRGEILYGLERLPPGRRRTDLERKAVAVLWALPSEPVPATAAEAYADTKAAQQRMGLVVDENDLWIAATALAIDAIVVSRDRDLSRIAGLNVEDWTV